MSASAPFYGLIEKLTKILLLCSNHGGWINMSYRKDPMMCIKLAVDGIKNCDIKDSKIKATCCSNQ